MSRKKAFTLVELLVVIGIIAVLIGILLPTLSRARESARSIKCASNQRQLALAIKLFAQEHKGYMPAASDEALARFRDPMRSIWVWRKSATDRDRAGAIIAQNATFGLSYIAQYSARLQ